MKVGLDSSRGARYVINGREECELAKLGLCKGFRKRLCNLFISDNTIATVGTSSEPFFS